MESVSDRYNRQKLIENWDQKKLQNARVGIQGSGPLAVYTALSLVALGVGAIDFYEPTPKKEDSKLSALEEILTKVNPDVKIERHSEPDRAADVIIDTSNSPLQKRTMLEHSKKTGVPFISASTHRTGGEFLIPNGNGDEIQAELTNYETQNQGYFPSQVIAGMITEEVRKTLMPLKAGEKPTKGLAYNLTSRRRLSNNPDYEANPVTDLSQKRVLIIGAGALGNFVALAAAMEGIGNIDIIDFDEVEPHNLNRQILFHDSVGKKKSTALAEEIKKINPNINVRGLVGKIDEKSDYFESQKPDLIYDCVDSFAVRSMINYYAIRNKIPLVSGGTSHSAGQVVVYEPGESACLDCKLSVDRALGTALQGSKCTEAPNPSVIMTNQIIGGMMVGESLRVLDRGYGATLTRILKYDSTAPTRGGLVGPEDPCDCQVPQIQEWITSLKERYPKIGGKE